jgi:hypothetical protein
MLHSFQRPQRTPIINQARPRAVRCARTRVGHSMIARTERTSAGQCREVVHGGAPIAADRVDLFEQDVEQGDRRTVGVRIEELAGAPRRESTRSCGCPRGRSVHRGPAPEWSRSSAGPQARWTRERRWSPVSASSWDSRWSGPRHCQLRACGIRPVEGQMHTKTTSQRAKSCRVPCEIAVEASVDHDEPPRMLNQEHRHGIGQLTMRSLGGTPRGPTSSTPSKTCAAEPKEPIPTRP